MLEFFWNLASFILALGILVTVHEFGHFWVARKNGVKVERFSVGFGQALWRKKDKYGTEFVIALIPLGGYVKMLDERVDEVATEDKDKTFNSKSVYQRIAIIGAGPFANFAFAVFAFYLMFLMGVPSVKPIVESVVSGSIAAESQFPVNSEIIAIGDNKVRNWQDVAMNLAAEMGNKSVTITTRTAGLEFAQEKQTTLNLQRWQFSPEKDSPMASLGLTPFRPEVETTLAQITAGSPAERAGLIKGDNIISFNHLEVNNDWFAFSKQIKELPNKTIPISVERNGQIIELIVTPGEKLVAGTLTGFLGVSPEVKPWPEKYLVDTQYGPINALSEASKETWNLVTLSLSMIGKLITGNISVDNLSGPIAIAQGAGTSANYGIAYFLKFLALISINLGIINLLPLPVLDGGHLLYYFIELLTGKPVPEKAQEIGFKFGAFVLLGLMSIAIFNDISRLG